MATWRPSTGMGRPHKFAVKISMSSISATWTFKNQLVAHHPGGQHGDAAGAEQGAQNGQQQQHWVRNEGAHGSFRPYFAD